MEEPERTASANPSPKQSMACAECRINPSKYKCPGCSLRSCSLPCVNAHKQRTGCNGKRQQTQFVPLSQFDDNLLLSDYNMLEDVKRVAESAQRMRMKLCGYSHYRLPFHLKSLRSAAASRRTRILFLPSGMSKRATNRSFYNNRKKLISWTIEWRFHSTDVALIDHGVDENATICSVVENHLKPGPWHHQLRQFCNEPLNALKFFIRKYHKGPKSPFRELDIKAPIRQQLANLVVLEYPIIHVFLPSDNFEFEVIKDVPYKPMSKAAVSSDHPSPKGVTFREEEIEDANPSDPQILDIMQHNKADPVFQVPHQDKRVKKQLNGTLDRPQLRKEGRGLEPVLRNDVDCPEPQDHVDKDSDGITEFDFEQGLIDAYPDLIALTNPDDFLDLEGLFAKVDARDTRTITGLGGAIAEEVELEEGEIVES